MVLASGKYDGHCGQHKIQLVTVSHQLDFAIPCGKPIISVLYWHYSYSGGETNDNNKNNRRGIFYI